MATASALVYTAASGQPLYGGRLPPPLPAWVLAQTLRTWGVIPASNTLDDLNPDNDPAVNPNYGAGPAPWRGAGTHNTIFTESCGAVAIPAEGRLVWINSGGHAQGIPAAAYDLLLDRATPQFRRLCTPSGALGRMPLDYAVEFARPGNPIQVDLSGRHRAQHTEAFQVHWPGRGIATLSGILLCNTGGSAATCRPYLSDKDTGELIGGLGAAMSPTNAGIGGYAAACFDTLRGVPWMKANGAFSQFATWGGPDADVWTDRGTGPPAYLAGGISMAYCPDHDLILVGNGGNDGTGVGPMNQSIDGGWGVLDPATGVLHAKGDTGLNLGGAVGPSFSGAPALGTQWPNGLRPGLCLPGWEPELGCFFAWDNNAPDTTKIMTIAPPATGSKFLGAWTTGELAVDPSNAVTPTERLGTGTYGRFSVFPALGICVVLPRTTVHPGYFFRYKVVV